jgi:hypothetical protein
MEALVAALICLALSAVVIIWCDSGNRFYDREIPWDFRELASRLVVIAGGLAGFAVTGMVLLVTLTRDEAEAETDLFDAPVFMFLTGYLFFVSAAFLFAFLPRVDADGKQPARIQFGLAANLMFRSVMIAWFALRPLIETFGLGVLADFTGGAITFSLALGGIFMMAILYGIGVITLRETVILPAITTVVWVSVSVLTLTVLPELQSTKSSLYLTAALYGLNVMTFLHFSLGLLAGMFDRVQAFSTRYSRDLTLVNTQGTMVLLTFLWMSIMGIL